jgi:hypothetical protein
MATTPDRTGDLQVSTDRMLIVAKGSFSDRGWTSAPTTEDLIGAGIIPAIGERITQRIHLPPLAYPQLLSLLVARPGQRDGDAGCFLYGDRLLAGGVTRCVLPRRHGGAGAVGPSGVSVGQRLAVSAARRRLIHALEEDLPYGSVVRVEADDLDLPRCRLDAPDAEPWRSGGEPPAWR